MKKLAKVVAGMADHYSLEIPSIAKDKWNGIIFEKGRDNLTIGPPNAKDVVLYSHHERKQNGIGWVSHTFSYTCKPGEEITAVLAYDMWDDGTGGNPKLKSGGVGEKEVSIEVTSQLMRGFHHKVIVYGKRKK